MVVSFLWLRFSGAIFVLLYSILGLPKSIAGGSDTARRIYAADGTDMDYALRYRFDGKEIAGQSHNSLKPCLLLLAQAPVILAAVNGCKMTNEMPYNAWITSPPAEIPNYVWSKKYDPKPLNIKSSKLIEIKIKEFYYLSKEVALRAAKMAVRGQPGRYLARWKMERDLTFT